ncbi:hypothetical protein M2272_004021 [Mycobacterium frederiksbergense]|uniref:Uncharacterized protein n=1 Tax=Mycolicibacterium frederiksbergense TaxID=117567 RepID=A0ABT6L378_9MYCO|nr:hypothetical protein [Mycolicibacterium frederiksbergense]
MLKAFSTPFRTTPNPRDPRGLGVVRGAEVSTADVFDLSATI